MRKGYLSHKRPAKAQASLRTCAVSPVPLLFADIGSFRLKHTQKGTAHAHWKKHKPENHGPFFQVPAHI